MVDRSGCFKMRLWPLFVLVLTLNLSCKEQGEEATVESSERDKCIPAPEQIYFASQMSLNGTFSVPSPNNTWNIWSITSDGKELKPITSFTNGQTSRIPQVSNDGRHLFFYSLANLLGKDTGDVFLSANVWTMDRKHEGDFEPVTENFKNTGLDSFGGNMTNGGTYFFGSTMDVSGMWSGTPSLSSNVFVLKKLKDIPVPLTKNTLAGLASITDSISPTGDQITVLSRTNLNGDWNASSTVINNLWLFSVDGKYKLALTKNTKAGLDTRGSSFFPDGKKLAFISTTSLTGLWDGVKAPQLNIWTINTDGTGLKNITSYKNANVQSIAVSPDGKKLLFRSTLALDGSDTALPNVNIWLMDVDGSNVIPITKNTVKNFTALGPRFSPDGKHVSFYSNTDLNGLWNGTLTDSHNLWVYNIEKKALNPLTRNSHLAIDTSVSTSHDWVAAGSNCK